MPINTVSRIEHYLACAGLTPNFKHILTTFGDTGILNYYKPVVVTKANAYLDDYPSTKIKNIYMQGNTSTGKSTLAQWLLYKLINKNPNFINAPVFISIAKMLESMRPGRDGEWDMYSRATECDLLVLDDIDAAIGTPWVIEKLYMLLNHRRDYMLPWIVTSNRSLGGIGESMAQRNGIEIEVSRIISRLESCDVWVF